MRARKLSCTSLGRVPVPLGGLGTCLVGGVYLIQEILCLRDLDILGFE